IPATISLNNNYYVKPIDENKSIFTNIGGTYNYRTLQNWKSWSGKDGNSKNSPKSITDLNDLRFEYNASTNSKTVSLDAKYIDAKGNLYDGSITLAPYASAVLIKNGASTGNQAPTANAGNDI